MLMVAGSTVTAAQAPFSLQPALSAVQPRQNNVPLQQQRLTAPAVLPSSLAPPLQTTTPAIAAVNTTNATATTAAAAAPMPGQLGNCITTGAPEMSTVACTVPPRTCDCLTLAPAAATQAAAVASATDAELEVDDLILSLPQVWLPALTISCSLWWMLHSTAGFHSRVPCLQVDWQMGNIF